MADNSQLSSSLETALSQRKLPCLVTPLPWGQPTSSIQSMQDTEPVLLPHGTTVKGLSGPELPTGVMEVTIETVPILVNWRLLQVFPRVIPCKAPVHMGISESPRLFPRSPNFSRYSEQATLAPVF